MRIKKHKNNEYIRAGGVWVRNFTKSYAKGLALTNMIGKHDHQQIMKNETVNVGYGNIAEESGSNFRDVLIISDGYDFKKRHQELMDFPDNIFIIAVNGALRNWGLVGTDRKRPINSYVVNNPYPECMIFMPNKSSRYFPTCVASTRTFPEFTKKYIGNLFVYEPTPEIEFGIKREQEKYTIDDYRNPICAAIGIAYQFGVKKLMLMCCDDSFAEQRDAAVQLENGLWNYPQQIRSHDIIEANLHWITHDEDEVVVTDYSNGPKYKNATYISCKDEALAFFEEESKEEDIHAETAITT